VDANDHVFVLPSPPTTNEKTFAQDFVDTPFAKRAFEKVASSSDSARHVTPISKLVRPRRNN